MDEEDAQAGRPETLSLEDALDILTDQTRARILLELGEAWGEKTGGPALLSYSELMGRTGVEDSGRFNYHLNTLVGSFVQKLDDGYVLHYPGYLIYQSLVAGILTDRPARESLRVGSCPECEGELIARYRSNHLLDVGCEDCEATIDRIPVPPQLSTNRDLEGVVDSAIQKQYHDLSIHRRGVCYGCGGRVRRELTRDTDHWDPPFDAGVYCLLTCEACHAQLITEPAHVALTTPAVAEFFARHGRDPVKTRSWERVLATAKASVSVVSETPIEVRVPFELDDELLELRLGDDLQVIDQTRSKR